MAKAKIVPSAPPRIRVRDLSWPLRIMITLSAVTAVLILFYVIVFFAYMLASGY